MSDSASVEFLGWMEFKIYKQYPAVGEMLEEIKLYGWRHAVWISKNQIANGHRWIIEEPSFYLSREINLAGICAKNR